MSVDGGERRGHTVVRYQSGHVQNFGRLARGRYDYVMKTVTLYEHVHKTLINRYRTVMNRQKQSNGL